MEPEKREKIFLLKKRKSYNHHQMCGEKIGNGSDPYRIPTNQ